MNDRACKADSIILHSSNKRLLAIVGIASGLVLACCLAFYFLDVKSSDGRRKSHQVNRTERLRVESEDFHELPLRLHGAEVQGDVLPAPMHGPIHARSTDYSFSGSVLIGDQQVDLQITRFRPFALIALDRQYFLLARHFRTSEFAYFTSLEGRGFELGQWRDFPRSLWNLTFDGDLETYSFRTSLWTGLADEEAHDEAIAVFNHLLELDERFAFNPRWKEPLSGNHKLSNYLSSYVQRQDRREYFDPLSRLLDNSKFEDDDGLIGRICLVLLALDENKGNEAVKAFIANVVRQEGRTDPRLRMFIRNERLSLFLDKSPH